MIRRDIALSQEVPLELAGLPLELIREVALRMWDEPPDIARALRDFDLPCQRWAVDELQVERAVTGRKGDLAVMAAPIPWRGHRLGTLSVASDAVGAYSPAQLARLKLLATFLGVARGLERGLWPLGPAFDDVWLGRTWDELSALEPGLRPAEPGLGPSDELRQRSGRRVVLSIRGQTLGVLEGRDDPGEELKVSVQALSLALALWLQPRLPALQEAAPEPVIRPHELTENAAPDVGLTLTYGDLRVDRHGIRHYIPPAQEWEKLRALLDELNAWEDWTRKWGGPELWLSWNGRELRTSNAPLMGLMLHVLDEIAQGRLLGRTSWDLEQAMRLARAWRERAADPVGTARILSENTLDLDLGSAMAELKAPSLTQLDLAGRPGQDTATWLEGLAATVRPGELTRESVRKLMELLEDHPQAAEVLKSAQEWDALHLCLQKPTRFQEAWKALEGHPNPARCLEAFRYHAARRGPGWHWKCKKLTEVMREPELLLAGGELTPVLESGDSDRLEVLSAMRRYLDPDWLSDYALRAEDPGPALELLRANLGRITALEPRVLQWLSHDDPRLRALGEENVGALTETRSPAAVRALGGLRNPAPVLISTMDQLVSDPGDWQLQMLAAQTLARWGHQLGFRLLVDRLDQGPAEERARARELLIELGPDHLGGMEACQGEATPEGKRILREILETVLRRGLGL